MPTVAPESDNSIYGAKMSWNIRCRERTRKLSYRKDDSAMRPTRRCT